MWISSPPKKVGKGHDYLHHHVIISVPPLEIRVISDLESFCLVLILKRNHKILKQISLFGLIQVFFIKQYTDFIERLKIYTRNNSFFSDFFLFSFFNLTFFPLNNPVSIMKRALVSTVAVLCLFRSKYCFQASSLPLLRLHLHLLRKQILEGCKD